MWFLRLYFTGAQYDILSFGYDLCNAVIKRTVLQKILCKLGTLLSLRHHQLLTGHMETWSDPPLQTDWWVLPAVPHYPFLQSREIFWVLQDLQFYITIKLYQMFRKVILSLGCTLELPGQLSENTKAWIPTSGGLTGLSRALARTLLKTPQVILTSDHQWDWPA